MRSIVGCISLCILNFVMVIPSTNDRANRNASSPSQQNTVPKKDLLGDPLPDGALMRLGTVRFRHGREITSAVFFHDGKTLATAGKDQIIRLWDSTTGQQLRRFDGHEYFLYAVALSPDGKLMATAEQEIYLWDLSTGKIIKKLGGGMGATWQLIFTAKA
jgi:WD40 repeat protein